MIVMKFGGSSVRDAERIRYVTEIIAEHIKEQPFLVFSALGKTTDNLIAAGQAALAGEPDATAIRSQHLETATALEVATKDLEGLLDELDELLQGIALLKELSPKTSDYLVSFGERLAVRLIAPYLTARGIPARFFDSWDLGFLTDSNFGNAQMDSSSYEQIARQLAPVKESYPFTPVVTGFIAKDPHGHITTLGRGGSDLTAAILGAALPAAEIQVWKDVDGILSTDPRMVPSAQPVAVISFEEAAELAYFGAKVLHPISMLPAMQYGIPVRVKNSYNPTHPGTVIVPESKPNGLLKALTYKRRVTLIDIVSSRMLGQYGFLARVFEVFREHHISVDMVATSEVSISLTVNDNTEFSGLVAQLSEIARVGVSKDKAILSLICDVSRSSQILDRVFEIFSANDINVQMISQGASKVNIGLIVEDGEIEKCIKLLHHRFFPENK